MKHTEKNLRLHYPMPIKNPKKAASASSLHFLRIASLGLLSFLLKTGGEVRDEVHTLVTDVDETKEPVKFAPVKRGHTSLARNTASDELSAC